MRIALKLSYLGNHFSGFQYQPDEHTVEGELFKAFEKLNIDTRKASYASAGRTDAGVHAFGQVVALNVDSYLQPRQINAYLSPHITVWGSTTVPEDFNPRYATSRTYMYAMLSRSQDISPMRKAAKLLMGTHDFTNFTRKFGEGKNCVRIIHNAELRLVGDFLILEIEGNAFTWNMVRCMVTALESIGRGQRGIKWLKEMLNPQKYKERIEPAPAHGLILKDVNYDGIDFEVEEYAWRTLQARIQGIVSYYGSIYQTFSTFME